MFINDPKTDEIYSWLQRELRTDHAGETGAIAIYDGILAMSSCKKVRGFATRHRETEKQHLQRIESLLPASQRSILLPVWRIAGFFTGAIPASISSSMVFATIAAVESFVDSHYSQQINRLSDKPLYSDISDILQKELGVDLGTEYFPNPYDGYQMHTQANIGSSKDNLGFLPKVSLEQGIKSYIPEIKRLHRTEIT